MTKRLVIGAAVAFVVISTSATSSTSLALAAFFKASFGPGVQRDHYLIPVIALAFAIYVAVMALVYPVFHLFFYERRGWSSLATGALLGLFCGFMWDALQGGIIEYATYHVSLAAMLVDSAYHTLEGALAGSIIGGLYRPAAAAGEPTSGSDGTGPLALRE